MAQKEITRAKKIINKYDLLHFSNEVFFWERQLALRLHSKPELSVKLKSIGNEEKVSNSHLENISEYYELSLKFSEMTEVLSVKKEASLWNELGTLMKNPLLTNEEAASNTLSKCFYYNIHAAFLQILVLLPFQTILL